MKPLKAYALQIALAALRLLPAEASHHVALKALARIPQGLLPAFQEDPCELWGLSFRNRIGIAAGLDKNADFVDALAKLNVGFIEVGTVTPKPQAGNPKPRLFRLPRNKSIINRMGFNNKGVDYLVEQIKQRQYEGVLGVNIGKNKVTPNDKALEDYLYCFERVYPYADYIVMNISSPNTPGLRDLQQGKYLDNLLAGVKAMQAELAQKHERQVPLLIKVAPDLVEKEIAEVAQSILHQQIDGVIISNTTISRDYVTHEAHTDEQGGLSGRGLKPLAMMALESFQKHLQHQIPVIGVGGISSKQDIDERLATGADLVQIYTGLLYSSDQLFNQL